MSQRDPTQRAEAVTLCSRTGPSSHEGLNRTDRTEIEPGRGESGLVEDLLAEHTRAVGGEHDVARRAHRRRTWEAEERTEFAEVLIGAELV